MRDLQALPKAHLHLHLEGSARPATIIELAEREGIELADLAAFSTLPEFIECYLLAASTVTRPADLERLCYELLVDEAAQGVRWCEPMVAPQAYVGRFGSIDDVWSIMRTGFDRAAAEHDIGWGVIVNHLRTAPVDLAEMLARWAADNAGHGVVGFGIAGDEEKVGPETFTRAFSLAAEAGLLLVPHAGETVGPVGVRAALALGAHRLAHGVRSTEDPDLLRILVDADVACDVCVTSNLKLSVVAALSDHPLPALLEAGVPVTLGSDDQLFFGSPVAEEYSVVREVFGLSDGELAAIARTSVRVSGAPPGLQSDITDAIAAWEAA
ncbi:MAG TPA: adenosine deaminase [Acidimicrobiales bacterium]|jgi:adenosine deaminase|nr:adenosine deaminase [Acidimicrobiales bacterium]